MPQIGQWRVAITNVVYVVDEVPVVESHFFEGDHALCGLFAVSESTLSEPTATVTYGVRPVHHDACEQILGTKETKRIVHRGHKRG